MNTVVLERFGLNRGDAERALEKYEITRPAELFHLRVDKGATGFEYVVIQEVE